MENANKFKIGDTVWFRDISYTGELVFESGLVVGVYQDGEEINGYHPYIRVTYNLEIDGSGQIKKEEELYPSYIDIVNETLNYCKKAKIDYDLDTNIIG